MPLINDLIPCGKGGIELDGFIREYQVQAGNNISAGDFVEFVNNNREEAIGGVTELYSTAGSGVHISAVKLDDSRVFVAFSICPSGSTTYNLYGIVITISGLEMSAGTVLRINSYPNSSGFSQGDGLAVCFLEKDKVFIACSVSNSPSYVHGVVCTISGTTIIQGTGLRLFSQGDYGGRYISVTALSSSKVVVVGYKGIGAVCSISGTTITVGSSKSIGQRKTKVIKLAENKVFVCYDGQSTEFLYTYCRVCTISGTTITTGTAVQASTLSYSGVSFNAVRLNDNKVLLLYGNGSSGINNQTALNGVVCTISGTSITLGTSTKLLSFINSYLFMSPILLEDGTIFLLHDDSACSLTVSGNNITVKEKYSNIIDRTYGNTSDVGGVLLDCKKIVMLYGGGSNNTLRGTIKQLPNSAPLGVKGYSSSIQGVANTSGIEGETIEAWQPYYTYKKYNVVSNTTTTTGYVESKSSSTSNVSLGSSWSARYISYANSITVDPKTGTITLNSPSQIMSSSLSSNTSVLNNKYFMVNTSGYVTSGTQAYLGNTTAISGSWSMTKAAYTITATQSTITTTEEVKGSLIEELKCEERIYPNNGKHTDGYWYVLNGMENYSGNEDDTSSQSVPVRIYYTGSSNSDRGCVAYNGTKITSNDTITANIGDTITIYVGYECQNTTGGYHYVKVNGKEVELTEVYVPTIGYHTYTYAYTVTGSTTIDMKVTSGETINGYSFVAWAADITTT